jgi:hypothetical protein
MSKHSTQSNLLSTESSLVAVIQRVGTNWRCLIVSTKEGERPEIAETMVVESEKGLESLIKSVDPTDIYCILPGSATVCRTTTLPDVDHDQMVQALRLQAESKFLGGTPEHRRAVSALDNSNGETNRVGLIVAWPDTSHVEVPDCIQNASFVPDAASIAALLDGLRPIEPLLYADPTDGTITIALTHANGAALRATREDATSNSTFIDGIARIVQETASAHNHTPAFTNSLLDSLQDKLAVQSCSSPILLLPEEVRADVANRIQGTASNDNAWWSMWGITVGGFLAATGSLQSLTTMKMSAPILHPSLSERFINRCNRKTVAMKLACVALLLLAVGPALVSGSKLGVLNLMNPELDVEYAKVLEERKQQIMYKELGQSAWPITKIASDVINNIPLGIEIDTLQINTGEPVSVRGSAQDQDGYSAAELIAKMQEKLSSTGMFKDIQFSYDPAGTFGKREFDLRATVTDPLKRPRYSVENDFGVWTSAMRKAGIQPEDQGDYSLEEPSGSHENSSSMTPGSSESYNSDIQPPAHIGDDREVPDRPNRPSGNLNSRTSSEVGSHTSERNPGGRNSSRIPEPLSAAQISVMGEDEAQIALAEVAEGLDRLPAGDEETKKRLNGEMRLLFDRLKEIKK